MLAKYFFRFTKKSAWNGCHYGRMIKIKKGKYQFIIFEFRTSGNISDIRLIPFIQFQHKLQIFSSFFLLLSFFHKWDRTINIDGQKPDTKKFRSKILKKINELQIIIYSAADVFQVPTNFHRTMNIEHRCVIDETFNAPK